MFNISSLAKLTLLSHMDSSLINHCKLPNPTRYTPLVHLSSFQGTAEPIPCLSLVKISIPLPGWVYV